MKKAFIIALLISAAACAEKPLSGDLQHYDLQAPVTYNLPAVLREISGIAFEHDKSDLMYAEQDERGTLFRFHFGDKDILETKFNKKGDYEDVAILRNTVIMLRSDGSLFTFPLGEVSKGPSVTSREWTDLLPAGEYESLFGDEKDGRLYILCKNCPGDKAEKEISGYVFALSTDGNIQPSTHFSVDTKRIASLYGDKKMRIRPSAIVKNYATNEWFLLSSVGRVLVITDDQWNAKQVVHLDPKKFNQPEGIAFDAQNNLYISNEGGVSMAGNILKFNYRQ